MDTFLVLLAIDERKKKRQMVQENS